VVISCYTISLKGCYNANRVPFTVIVERYKLLLHYFGELVLITTDTSRSYPTIPVLISSTEAVTPRVSVIIPVYQGDRFLAEAVESVLNQTYTNYEIIVINDGSTDNSDDVLFPYLEKIRYVYQKNQGVAAARNLGIQMARGELIAFLDQDDFWLADKLALQVACFQAQPTLGIVNSGWQRVNELGQATVNVELWHKVSELDLRAWLHWKPLLPSAMMFSRQWLERAGGFDTRFTQSSDVDMVLRLALMGCEAAWVPQITTCYRQHECNTMNNSIEQAESIYGVIDNFFSRPDLPSPIRLLEKEVRYQTLVWVAWYLYSTGYLPEMKGYLEESLSYTPYSRTKTISDLLKNFSIYAIEHGYIFDVRILTNSQEWQELISVLINGSLNPLPVLNTNYFDTSILPEINIGNSLIKLPATGSVIQEGEAKGFWPHDGWASGEVSAYFRAEKTICRVKVIGYIPAYHAPLTKITLTVDEQLVSQDIPRNSSFCVEIPVKIDAEDYFQLSIIASETMSGVRAGFNEDVRELAFVLSEIACKGVN
jgi:glycosyltransferase involved in cell wall biosynthesis